MTYGSHIPVLAGFPSATAPSRVSFHAVRLLLSETSYNWYVAFEQREILGVGSK